jgi:hypothetical protein
MAAHSSVGVVGHHTHFVDMVAAVHMAVGVVDTVAAQQVVGVARKTIAHMVVAVG